MEQVLRNIAKLILCGALSISAVFMIIFWYKSRSKIDRIWKSDEFLFNYGKYLDCQERKNNFEKLLEQLEKENTKDEGGKTALRTKIEGMKAMIRVIATLYNEMSDYADPKVLKDKNLPKKLEVVQ